MKKLLGITLSVVAMPLVILGMHNEEMPTLYRNCVDDYWHELAPHFTSYYQLQAHKAHWIHRMHEGGRITYAIMQDVPPAYTNQESLQDNIYKVISFLYAISLPKTKRQNGFHAGAFLVQDAGRIYDFLSQYPAKKEVKAKSHEDKGPLDKSGYAIDICPTHASALSYFVAGKQHLYFVKDNTNNATYIRPESKSRNDTSQQVISGIGSLWRKYGCGTNDAPEYHKPHVPKDIYDAYCETIQYCVSDRRERETYKQDTHRVSRIVDNLRMIAKNQQLKEVQHKMIDQTINTIYQRCDYPEIRYGDEIILGDEVLPLAYYYTLSHQQQEENVNSEHVQQQRDLLQTYALLRHHLYRLRNPEINTIYAQGHNEHAITIYDIDTTMSQFIDMARHTKTGDTQIDTYFETITQRCMGVQQDYNKSARERRVKTEPILETVGTSQQ